MERLGSAELTEIMEQATKAIFLPTTPDGYVADLSATYPDVSPALFMAFDQGVRPVTEMFLGTKNNPIRDVQDVNDSQMISNPLNICSMVLAPLSAGDETSEMSTEMVNSQNDNLPKELNEAFDQMLFDSINNPLTINSVDWNTVMQDVFRN